MKVLKISLKRILVILMIFVTLMFFFASAGPGVQAKSKLPNEGEFYYAGTTKGTYTVVQGIFDWLLENLGAIVDWFLGLSTMLIRMVFVGWTALIEMLLTWVLETTMNMEVEVGTVSTTGNTDSTGNVTVEAIVFGLVPIFDVNIFNLEYPKTTATGINIFEQVCETCEKVITECTCNTETTGSEDCYCSTCKLKAEQSGLLKVHEMKCDTCGKGVNDCTCVVPVGKCDTCKKEAKDCSCSNSCTCRICKLKANSTICSCELCKIRSQNTMLKVKETVSEWYYIIRLIAIAAMLVVLIGIGIKMLTTSIASDKALYKRMIVDWMVGMIILFAIHYAMILIININDSLVRIIREASMPTAATTATDADDDKDTEIIDTSISSFRKAEKSNSNIEISLYEEVRTRAYDPKMVNGMTGMVMYATLVYFAIRFSFVYIKRYFTIIVLTLMAPGIGIAYAIQKVLTGKSQSLSTWLTEYIMNVIIQVVHAIMYAAFVNMALKLALQSISGIILAFVILNYMLKAEKLFKKIFKMSSKGGLLEDTDSAGDPDRIKGAISNVTGLAMAAKPIGNVLMKSPITKAAFGIAKAPIKAGVLGGALLNKAVDESGIKDKVRSKISSVKSDISDKVENGDFFNNRATGRMMKRAYNRMKNKRSDKMAVIAQGMKQGGYDEDEEIALKSALYTDQRSLNVGETEEERRKESALRWAEYESIRKANRTYKRATKQTTMGVVSAHIGKLLDYNNYFVTEEVVGKNGEVKQKLKRKGKWIYDERTKKPVYIDSLSSLIGEQLKPENLLGFSEQNKKQMKDTMKYIGVGLLGVGGMFIGLGTCVTHPKLGMPLLANGIAQTTKMMGRNKKKIKGAKRISLNNYSEETLQDVEDIYEEMDAPRREVRYRFERFNSGAMLTMQAQLQKAYEEDEQTIDEATVKHIMTRHPRLATRIIEGTVKPVSAEKLATMLPEIGDTELDSESVLKAYTRATPREESFLLDHVFGGIGEEIDKLSLAHQKQIEDLAKKEKKVAVAMISDALQSEYMQKLEEFLSSPETTESEETPVTPRRENVENAEFIPLVEKTRESIESPKDISSIIEVAILEEAAKTQRDVTQISIEDGKSRENIKKIVADILVKNSGMIDGQKVEDVIKDFDKEISEAKVRLDKGFRAKKEAEMEVTTPTQPKRNNEGTTTAGSEKPRKKAKSRRETLKDILMDATISGTEADFIKEITGFDVDASDESNMEASKKRAARKGSKTPGLTKKEENKVVELLLLQKQMREINVEAAALKMTPLESHMRYEASRTVVAKERTAGERAREKARRKKQTPSSNCLGPMTNIIDLISEI